MINFYSWITALTNPKETFAREKGKANWKDTILYMLLAGFIGGLIPLLFSLLPSPQMSLSSQSTYLTSPLLLFFQFFGLVFSVFFAIISLFLISGVLYFFAIIFKGRGDFTTQTYLISLALAPTLILSSLLSVLVSTLMSPVFLSSTSMLYPFGYFSFFISLLPYIYFLWPLTIALKETHNFSLQKAILSWASSILVLVVLLGSLLGFFILMFGFLSPGPGAANTARGFGRIKVMEPSIKYETDGSFSFTIMNGAGQTVSDLVMTASGSGCDTTEQNLGQLTAGETKSLSLTCDSKSGGDSFSVDVTFSYDMVIGGQKAHHEEEGTIRGAVEPS